MKMLLTAVPLIFLVAFSRPLSPEHLRTSLPRMTVKQWANCINVKYEDCTQEPKTE